MKFPIPGSKKIKRKFLFLPQGPDGDIRWLEFAIVEYIYKKVAESHGSEWRWVPNRFVDGKTD